MVKIELLIYYRVIVDPLRKNIKPLRTNNPPPLKKTIIKIAKLITKY